MKGKFTCSLPWLASVSRGKQSADGWHAAILCGESFFSSAYSDGCSSASLFLPAAGYRYDGTLNNVGSNGNYWSRTLNTSNPSNPNNAYNLNFNSGSVNTNNNNRNNGQSVRAVRVP